MKNSPSTKPLHPESQPVLPVRCEDDEEDLIIAKKASEEYDRFGIKGTTPYAVYREKRLKDGS